MRIDRIGKHKDDDEEINFKLLSPKELKGLKVLGVRFQALFNNDYHSAYFSSHCIAAEMCRASNIDLKSIAGFIVLSDDEVDKIYNNLEPNEFSNWVNENNAKIIGLKYFFKGDMHEG